MYGSSHTVGFQVHAGECNELSITLTLQQSFRNNSEYHYWICLADRFHGVDGSLVWEIICKRKDNQARL